MLYFTLSIQKRLTALQRKAEMKPEKKVELLPSPETPPEALEEKLDPVGEGELSQENAEKLESNKLQPPEVDEKDYE